MISYSDDETTFSKSKKDEILEKLKKRGNLGYGSVIDIEEIEEIFGVIKENEKEKEWNLMVLCIMQIITSLRFFATTRGRQGAIYILEPHEMPPYNENKNRLAYNNLTRRQRGLHTINPQILSENQSRKLEFEIIRNGHLQLEMSKRLKERCRI